MVKVKSDVESTSGTSRKSARGHTYFLSLTIENVRCFGPQQTLDLSNGKGRPAQWTIILGENGIGKTTLLQSLVALTPVFGTMFSLVPRGYDPFAGVKIVQMPDWNPFRYSDESMTRISAVFCGGIKLAEDDTCKKLADFVLAGSSVYGWDDITFLDLKEGVGNMACYAYGASRRMGETSLSKESETIPYNSLFSGNVELLNAEEWLLQTDYASYAAKDASTRKQAETQRDEIKNVLIKLLPDVEDIRVAQHGEKQLKLGVEVKTPYGWVSIKDLSLGYKTLIAWMVDFASGMFNHYSDSSDPLAEPAVVLVDEIDLHLHPKWQRTLMSYLSERFPNTQFIATAHSPLVVQAASDANVVLLRREGDHVVIDNNVKDIHGWRVDQILTSDLFGLESARPPQLDSLLAERTKILSKSRLTKKDKARLEEIEAGIGALPTGETPEDMEAMDVIRRAAEHLKTQGF
ncbi:MAG: AAA family ATPase [Acidobacteria bacterium]|nr:AAA family ATPase [Acidobacteriota bacterium]